MTDSVSLGAAFVAGIVSFLAPCTLALVPAYVLSLASFTMSDRSRATPWQLRRASILNTLTFALGFSTVFVALGGSLGVLSATFEGQAIWLNRVGGALVIAFGLVSLGLFKVSILERGLSFDTEWAKGLRYLGSLVVGGAFAVGWVPCVGPILAAILALAGTTGSAASGALLLFAYSLGLMLPFVGAGVFSGWTTSLIRRHGRVLTVMNYAGGAGLVVLGILVYTDLISALANYVPVTL
jgi:cytochrome c-type biogenesis protein